MAVTIKLKNASGSDPSASDLVVGEVAIRTDTGKLFTKKDDNSVAEISGGGIDDGDKGDITVSNSGGTFTIDNDVVTFAKMQNVSTSRLLGRTTSSSGDIEELTASAVRTLLNVADGATNVTNTNQLTNGAGFITATLTNEQVQDIVGGMVSGNTETGITVTYQDGDGTLDFVVGTLNQDTTGNAATATTLETARTIAGVSFDGSANISLNNNAITNGAGYITGSSLNASNLSSGTIPDARFPANLSISTTITCPQYQVSGSQPFITLNDTDNENDFSIQNIDGVFRIRDVDAGDNRLTLTSAGQFNFSTNVDFGAGVDVTGDITGTGNLTLTSTDGGSSAAPELELYRNSASPADADYLGQLKFTGESDDGSKEVYAKITGKIDDASSGTEDGIIEFAHRKAGSNVITGRFKSTELQLLNGTNLDVDGTCTATTFSGSGASLTNLPAAQLTGTLPAINGSNLTNISATVAGGAAYENAQSITSDYTVTNGKNAMSAGPITIDSGVTVTVGSGETYTIV